jgi:hypothetical protein
MELFKELIETSQTEKRGLTIFFNGQTFAGIVTKVIGTEAIEIRNQTYSRMTIRFDRIEARAIN